jgi:predicted ribosome quality control (RQC) complex YloA/Tae2 family protein
MIILDEDGKIINAFKHISPFDNADRTIINGVDYPLPIDEKLYQNDFEKIKEIFNEEVSFQDLISKIKGISPLFANYVIKKANDNHHRMYDEYINAINSEVKPTMYLGNKPDFYYFDVFSKDKKYYDSLSELLDNYYLEASAMERVKQVYKYIQTFTKQELKRKKHKIEKLYKDLKNALENDILRIKGDIIITYQNQIKKGDASFIGYSYELEKDIEIELDRLLNPIQNANKYYSKYKKQKTAISHIKEQINITQEQVKYLDEIQSQISNTFSLPDLLEIQDELRSNGFLPKKKVQGKKSKPNFDTYYDDLGVMILVGKNNLQNNYLTHKYAKKEYWWFHTKEQTGSHVIVCQTDDTLSETTIRTAANLSACFSKSKLSSSVPIDYTKIKHLKKVPGIYGSYVTYTNQKTIYIDPDLEQLNSYKKGR